MYEAALREYGEHTGEQDAGHGLLPSNARAMRRVRDA
jgi:hypothetical protein